MTLRSMLIVLIVAVTLATLLLGSVATYLHALNKVATEMEAAIAVGGRIAHNAVDDVEEATNARRRLELLVADFDGDRHLKAEVRDGTGRALFSSKLSQPEDPVPDWFYNLIGGAPRVVEVELPEAFRGAGRVVLSTDSRNEVGEVWDDMINTLTILFAFCVMVLGIVYGTLGRALRPLENLARGFGEIGEKGYAVHLPEAGPVELRRVYRGFNEMVERLASTEARNHVLQEQLLTVQEEERAEIARDLHDEIGPFLFSADVDATTVKRLLADYPSDDIRERVERIRDSVGHMQRHVREILSRLRAGPISDLGLAIAIDNLVAFWRGRLPDVEFDVGVVTESFGQPLDGTIYRVVQESLSNAVKHGKPTRIRIAVFEEPADVVVSIEDNGVGLPETPKRSGYGITGMRERVTQLGGVLTVASAGSHGGVRVEARIPIQSQLSGEAGDVQSIEQTNP